jgi:transposase-like protein
MSEETGMEHRRGSDAVCPRCNVRRLVRIGMSLSGRLVVMNSCPDCGTSWADGEGKPIALRKVLRMASPRR